MNRPVAYAIAIPSLGRPEILHQTVASLSGQTLPPTQILLAVTSAEDVDERTGKLPNVQVIVAPKGLTRQRNATLDALATGLSYVAFLDDDVELAGDYMERMAEIFAADQRIVLATGQVLVNGNISRDAARELVGRAGAPDGAVVEDIRESYGCNMFVRIAALDGVRFDERLPLYGWLEDLDFARAMTGRGRVVKASAARLVHLHVQSGRISGRRFGFAQIVNPHYLAGKGRIEHRSLWWTYWGKALVANSAGSLRPGAAHRRERLHGNVLAFASILRGTAAPERMLEI